MTQTINLLDVVALLGNVPEKKLARGEVGTVVENLAPGVFEVEFSDDAGRTYASAALRENTVDVAALWHCTHSLITACGLFLDSGGGVK